MDHDEAVRLYGPWKTRTPSDVADLLCDYPGRWWVAGGWALERFTGVARRHDDIDPSIPRSDVGLLCEHLTGTADVWSADGGTLRPLTGGDGELSPTCENLWLRDGPGRLRGVSPPPRRDCPRVARLGDDSGSP